jgi:hypothetical protein
VAVLGRFRRAHKAPLAVAGILATPLFFVGLMAFSLEYEKPTVMLRRGKEVLGDPTGATEARIWLSALALVVVLLVVGMTACFLPRRFAVSVPAVTALGIAVALRLPLDTWEASHTSLYPQGVDLVRDHSREDKILRGEWEANARQTAEQLSFWTIAIAVAAIAVMILLEVQRRRHPVPPPVPPPPTTVAGGTPT